MKHTSGQLSGNLVVVLYFGNKIVQAGISALAVYLGYRLFVLGVSGQASLVVNAHSIAGHLVNAAPGLFFAVGGLVALVVVVWKGSNFTLARENPDEIISMCMPDKKSRNPWLEAFKELANKQDTQDAEPPPS